MAAPLHPAQQPGATVQLGVKDTRLFREAADAAGVHLGMANYVQEQLNAANRRRDGAKEMDWTVAQYRMAEKAANKNSSTDSYSQFSNNVKNPEDDGCTFQTNIFWILRQRYPERSRGSNGIELNDKLSNFIY